MSIECDWKTIEHEDGSRTSYCSYSYGPGTPWEDAFERWARTMMIGPGSSYEAARLAFAAGWAAARSE
jgi:hypothetical protein